jgi:hypothetical protein
MSQPCSAVELLLFDALSLDDADTRDALVVAMERDMRRGALGKVEGAMSLTEADVLEFWMEGTPDESSVARVAALTGIEPERMLFISAHASSRLAAEQAGVRASAPDWDEIDRMLV